MARSDARTEFLHRMGYRFDGDGYLRVYKAIAPDGRPMHKYVSEEKGLPSRPGGIACYKRPGLYKDKSYGVSGSSVYCSLVNQLDSLPFHLWTGLIHQDHILNWTPTKVYANRMVLMHRLSSQMVARALSEEAAHHTTRWGALDPSEWTRMAEAAQWSTWSSVNIGASVDQERVLRLALPVFEAWEQEKWPGLGEYPKMVIIDREKKPYIETPLFETTTEPLREKFLAFKVAEKTPFAAEIRRLIGGWINSTGVSSPIVRDAIQIAIICYLNIRLGLEGSATKDPDLHLPWLKMIAEGYLPLGMDRRDRLVVVY